MFGVGLPRGGGWSGNDRPGATARLTCRAPVPDHAGTPLRVINVDVRSTVGGPRGVADPWRRSVRWRGVSPATGQPQSGSQGLDLEAVTAALLDGCALNGDKGTIFGTMLAWGTPTSGMILLGIQSLCQPVAKGALPVLAVMTQQHRLSRTGVQTGTAFT